jgi:hypothetical protein
MTEKRPFRYKVKAVGYGGFNSYPVEFTFSSNYNNEGDDYERDRITERLRSEMLKQGAFTSYKIVSVEKI